MSKIVTFTNPAHSYSFTKDILISEMNLNIPDQIYDNIQFVNNVKIIVYSGEAIENLENETNIIENYDTIGIINPCRIMWNGYGKYLRYKDIKCNKKCEESKCTLYENYEEYIKNKQMRTIPQFTKLVLDNEEYRNSIN
jgi:hypothetical protein